jgi:ketosteroid isomerase-like protein
MRTSRILSPLPVVVMATASLVPSTTAAQEGRTVPEETARSVEEAVLETNRRMTEAVDSLDFDAFFDFFASGDGVTIVQDGDVFRSLDAARAAVEAGYAGIRRVERRYENPSVTVLSSDAALLVSEGPLTVTLMDDRQFSRRFAVSLLFVRRTDGWKVLHGHYSMPDPGF